MPFTDMTKTYTIELGNGIIFTDLKLNGNNFVSKEEITEEQFEGGLFNFSISDGEQTVELTDYKLAALQHMDGVYGIEDGYYFVVAPYSEMEKMYMSLHSDMEYLAMMADCEL